MARLHFEPLVSIITDFLSYLKASFLFLNMPVKFQEVLPYEQTRSLETVNVSVMELRDPRFAADSLKAVNTLFPGGQLSHLKRVRKCGDRVQILLERIEFLGDSVRDRVISCIPVKDKQKIAELSEAINASDIITIPVSRHAAATREQFEDWGKLWQVTFRRPAVDPINEVSSLVLNRLKKVLEHPDSCLFVSPEGNEFFFVPESPSDNPLDHTAIRGVEYVSQRTEPDTYLCTGFDYYSKREPCVMCGMALLHSRIGSVYFTEKRSQFGAFCDLRLNCNPQLNHRFRVLHVQSLE